MADFLLAGTLIFAVMVGWLYVQDLYARFAARHPELGPYRRQGGCGGGSCSCSQGSCPTKDRRQAAPRITVDPARRN
jgi:hypothetical protein